MVYSSLLSQIVAHVTAVSTLRRWWKRWAFTTSPPTLIITKAMDWLKDMWGLSSPSYRKPKKQLMIPMLWFSFTTAHHWVILCHHHLKCCMVKNPLQTYHKFSTTPHHTWYSLHKRQAPGENRWKHPPHRDQSNVHHTPWQNLAPSNSWRVPKILFLQNKGWQWCNICQDKATLKTLQAVHSATTKTSHMGTASSFYDATSINLSKKGTHMYGLVNKSE